jgi:tetratricopeptide (TPR) repeat protein
MAQAYLNRSLSNLATDYQQAITDYETAKGIDENIYDSRIEARIYLNRALSYNLDTDYQQAIASYEKAVSLDPNISTISTENHANIAQTYLKYALSIIDTDYHQAIDNYEKAVSLDPNISTEKHANIAQAYYNKGIGEEFNEEYGKNMARINYEKAIALYPRRYKEAEKALKSLNRNDGSFITTLLRKLLKESTAARIV